MNKLALLVALLGAFMLAFAGVYFLAPTAAPAEPTPIPTPEPVAPPPTVLNDKRQMPDFTLTNQDGKPVKLSDLRGKPIILFFGYTFCPDVCPLTLSEMLKAKKALGADGDKAQFVFVSVDGERDTPEVLKNYLKLFDPTFIGLTGAPDDVRAVASEYGASFVKKKPEGTSAAYLIVHTSNTYLLDAQGRWRVRFSYMTKPEVIAQYTKNLLSE